MEYLKEDILMIMDFIVCLIYAISIVCLAFIFGLLICGTIYLLMKATDKVKRVLGVRW